MSKLKFTYDFCYYLVKEIKLVIKLGPKEYLKLNNYQL